MNKIFSRGNLLIGVAALVFAPSSQAAPFAPGDLVIYRVGDGTQTLTNTGNSVFLDEYTPTGTLVQSVAVPTTAVAGGNQALVASGTASSEGQLTLSGNGQSLVFTGYNPPAGTTGSLTGTASATVNRTVGTVNAAGVVNTVSTFTDFSTGNNPRSAYSPDGASVYLVGGAGGIRFGMLGVTGATSTQLSTTPTTLRYATVSNGQLYVSSSSGTIRIATVGTGVPTTSGQTITNLPGITATPTGNSNSPYAFAFATLSLASTAPDTLYVADDAVNGIQKYSLVGGNWTLNGVIAAAGIRGLTLSVTGGVVSLFGTTGAATATGGGTLFGFVDNSGYNAIPANLTAVTLATLSTTSNEAFRGIAFAPVVVPEPSTYGLLLIGGAGVWLAARRRSRAGVA